MPHSMSQQSHVQTLEAQLQQQQLQSNPSTIVPVTNRKLENIPADKDVALGEEGGGGSTGGWSLHRKQLGKLARPFLFLYVMLDC
jgi:hypothetical protein